MAWTSPDQPSTKQTQQDKEAKNRVPVKGCKDRQTKTTNKGGQYPEIQD